MDSWSNAIENVGYRTKWDHKFNDLLYKPPSETLRMLEEARGQEAMKTTRVYEGHKCFPDGRASAEDDPSWERTSTWTNDKSMECAQYCARWQTKEYSEDISGSVHSALTKIWTSFTFVNTWTRTNETTLAGHISIMADQDFVRFVWHTA
jgi:hypothetical protein